VTVAFTEAAAGLTGVTVNAGAGADLVLVRSTPAGVATTVNGGDGNDTVTAGDAGNKLDALLGAVAVNGEGGRDSLSVNDQGKATGGVYALTGTAVLRGGGPTVTYQGLEALTVNTSAGADSVAVQGTAAGTVTQLNTGGGADTVVVSSAAATL